MGVKKKLQLTSLMVLALFVMSACTASGTTSEITAESTGFWSKFVYFLLKLFAFYHLIQVLVWGLFYLPF